MSKLSSLAKLVLAVFLLALRFIAIFSLPFVTSLMVCALIVNHISSQLPDLSAISDYSPPISTKVYSASGTKMAEFSSEKRSILRYNDTPQVIIDAFLSAEDKNFFVNSGFNLMSIMRASMQSLINYFKNKRAIGASTITQQLVRAVFLTNKRDMTRKISEVILAYRLTKSYTKEKILEMYLNHVFLGEGAYGVSSAARIYFDKDVDDLSIEEAATLAALPKAPSAINPFVNIGRAKERRNWVIKMMFEAGAISKGEAARASAQGIKLRKKSVEYKEDDCSYYVEEVRKELISMFGNKAVYESGMVVITNMIDEVQKQAKVALKYGIERYGRRRAWGGPLKTLKVTKGIYGDSLSKGAALIQLGRIDLAPVGLAKNFKPAVVLSVSEGALDLLLRDGRVFTIKPRDLSEGMMFRDFFKDKDFSLASLFNLGDVLLVSEHNNKLSIEQSFDVNGGIVVLEPKTFKVLGMVGGCSWKDSKFNRVTMASRQVGSIFKPFIYLAALEKGFSPDMKVMDAPITIEIGKKGEIWSPRNHDDKYMGEISMETALKRSRNTPVVRLAIALGLDEVMDVAARFGIYNGKHLKDEYSLALGSFSSSLLRITNAYNSLASDGNIGEPSIISAIYNKEGELIYRDPSIRCFGCNQNNIWSKSGKVFYPVFKKYVKKAAEKDDVDYLTDMLRMKKGSGLASKTGTTNNSNDAWCLGYTKEFTVGVYVGFDSPASLGKNEYGSTVARPILNKFYAIDNNLSNDGIYDSFYEAKGLDILMESK